MKMIGIIPARKHISAFSKQLSEKTGIPIRHISEMENGKRPIGQKNARLLGDVLSIDPRMLRAR